MLVTVTLISFRSYSNIDKVAHILESLHVHQVRSPYSLVRKPTLYHFFFFFQAEDGIRDVAVTGVQTCALPICSLALRQTSRALRRIEPKMPEQLLFRLPIPIRTKGSEVIQRLANTHPRIECHLVGYVREKPLHRDFLLCRIETEYPHLPALRAQQIEQTLHRGCLARAVATEKSVTSAGLHCKAQIMDGLRAPVGV